MVNPLITLVAAVLALVAVGLIPGSKAIKKGETEGYLSWGKGAVYFIAVMVLVVGGYVFYSWYSNNERDILTTANGALFLVLGIGIAANNAFISRKIAKEKVKPEALEVEVLEVDIISDEGLMEEKDTRPVKPRPKKVKKAAPPSRPMKKAAPKKAPKKAKKPKVKKAAPKPKVKEELIPEDVPAPSKGGKCPSCDTPIHHANDDSCPVCGEDLRG